jgi:hypothetical protein
VEDRKGRCGLVRGLLEGELESSMGNLRRCRGKAGNCQLQREKQHLAFSSRTLQSASQLLELDRRCDWTEAGRKAMTFVAAESPCWARARLNSAFAIVFWRTTWKVRDSWSCVASLKEELRGKIAKEWRNSKMRCATLLASGYC